jgi:hypothetical protein
MADGFLGRWSQRKRDVREGKPLQEPAPTPIAPEQAAAPRGGPQAVHAQTTPAPVPVFQTMPEGTVLAIYPSPAVP